MSERKIGLAIKRRRKELGLSQSELASRLGYKDHSTLAKVETGVNDITVDTLFKYAKALDISVTDLLNYSLDEAKASITLALIASRHYRISMTAKLKESQTARIPFPLSSKRISPVTTRSDFTIRERIRWKSNTVSPMNLSFIWQKEGE